jgi:2-dehydropantoate 2-reductase
MQTTGKFKIGILGIGGVGGYFGGKLAGYYEQSNDVQIIFIAQGENKKKIQQQGLQIFSSDGLQTVYPTLASDDANEIGPLNLLICCTKTYQLEAALLSIQRCITRQTILLPLLNGVTSAEQIKNLFPQNEVWEGCVYVASRLQQPGIIRKSGTLNALYFGSSTASQEMLIKVEALLKVDGINAQLALNILQTVWEKFLFISTVATLTSYLNKNIGQIRGAEAHIGLLERLLHELYRVTKTKGIALPENSIRQTLDKMASFPYEATSSMHSDYQKSAKTEVDALTGYVVQLGKELNVPTPTYELMYERLKALSA